MKKRKDLDRFYHEKRSEKHLRRLSRYRKDKSRKKRAKFFETRDEMTTQLRKEGHYISQLVTGSDAPSRGHLDKSSGMLSTEIRLPQVFSIIDNPEESIQVFKGLEPALYDTDVEWAGVRHSDICEHDLAAEILLGRIGKYCMDLHSAHGKSFEIKGNYPSQDCLARKVKTIGLVKALEVDGEKIDDDAAEAEKIVLFHKRGAKEDSIRIGSLDSKTRATQGFVDHINDCLMEADYQLTEDASQELVEYVGEILANAQEHSGTGEWEIYGYLDKQNEERMCEAVIYNFGNTISDTFDQLPEDDYARGSLNKYIAQHENKALFGKNWDKDSLTTLFALQGRVSSKNSEDDSTRGQGTVDLIEFFQMISEEGNKRGGEHAKMCILSGHNHIRFDGKYRLVESRGQPIIAFNKENNLSLPPDPNYVKKLKKAYFPGTLIAIQFILPDTATEELEND
ncbi:hypothetical protein [Marinobacter sp.]|jgi:hypothetical protein|uniref:hypothetical protein n=1 Tax=Marinobacter sp. TaxID=50741 RepID=UPI002588150E|nr:hypothetical protein [Marinobacter sp.]|tara:strand:- start:1707 stop:3065 length:1359 start_codon:yes stop_codon:yes gene_type:complete